jgi:hypothetical protein
VALVFAVGLILVTTIILFLVVISTTKAAWGLWPNTSPTSQQQQQQQLQATQNATTVHPPGTHAFLFGSGLSPRFYTAPTAARERTTPNIHNTPISSFSMDPT